MFNAKLTIQLVPITFGAICSYKSTDYSFTIKCMSQHLKMVTLDLLKNIFSHKQSRKLRHKMNCVLLTISMWYKQSIHNTNIYKLEITE